MLVGLSSWQGLRDCTTQHEAHGNTQQMQMPVTAQRTPSRQNASYLVRTKDGRERFLPSSIFTGEPGHTPASVLELLEALWMSPAHSCQHACPCCVSPPAREASNIWGERQQSQPSSRCHPWARPASGLREGRQQLQSHLLPLSMHQGS